MSVLNVAISAAVYVLKNLFGKRDWIYEYASIMIFIDPHIKIIKIIKNIRKEKPGRGKGIKRPTM